MSLDIDSTVVGGSHVVPIMLGRMPQQATTNVPDDDWTGVSNPAERRKRQNRLNVRAYRKRKKVESLPSTLSSSSPKYLAVTRPIKARDSLTGSALPGSSYDSGWMQHQDFQEDKLWPLFHSAAGVSTRLDVPKLARTAAMCKSSNTETQTTVLGFEQWVHSKAGMGSPAADNLLVLVKFNVFRALISNSMILGFPIEEGMQDDTISPFTPPSRVNDIELVLPSALRPTTLQQQILHHPWIDLIPIPRMRDNLLRAGDSYDDLELCADLVGFFNSPAVRTGLIIWGDPWDPAGWEITQPFLKNWGWTIRGCLDIFESTNYWRSRRGEKPLCFDGLLLCEEIE